MLKFKKITLRVQDCGSCPLKKDNGHCSGKGGNKAEASSSRHLKLVETGEEWVTAKTFENALTIAAQCTSNKNSADSVRFVAGNTSTG